MGSLGAIMGSLGAIMGCLGAIMGCLGAVLETAAFGPRLRPGTDFEPGEL